MQLREALPHGGVAVKAAAVALANGSDCLPAALRTLGRAFAGGSVDAGLAEPRKRLTARLVQQAQQALAAQPANLPHGKGCQVAMDALPGPATLAREMRHLILVHASQRDLIPTHLRVAHSVSAFLNRLINKRLK